VKIDVHWHHVPQAVADGILDGRVPVSGTIDRSGDVPAITMPYGFRLRLQERLLDTRHALAALDDAGLDLAVPTLAPPLRQYDADVASATTFCRAVNDAFAQVQQDTGGRLRPLADVPLQDANAAVAELRRAVGELDLLGVGIGTNVNGRNLGDEEYRPFWRAVAELDTFVFLHPETVMGAHDRLCRHELENLVGFPVDTAAAAASMIFDGVYQEFGPLKTCYAHGGGAFPYLLSRWEHGYHARIAGRGTGVQAPTSYLGSLYCDSLVHGAAQLRFLVEVVGEDHVVLGGDYPFDMGDPQPVAAMERTITDERARALIAGETAARLLGLEERVPSA
jgi:aminocarboxymuconate-semialdehyde decarboxylase